MPEQPASPGDALVIELAGVFDERAASDLRRHFGALPAGADVVVDFRQVRDVHDRGLAIVASALAQCGAPRIAMRGLSHHHRRLFRYLGLDVDAAQRSAP